MKKFLVIFFALCTSLAAFATPKANITIRFDKLRINNDSITFAAPRKLEFKNVGKKMSEIQSLYRIGGYEVGVAVRVDGFGKNKQYAKMGIKTGKGFINTVFYYCRKGDGAWELLTQSNMMFPITPGHCITSSSSSSGHLSIKSIDYFSMSCEFCEDKA